MNNFFNVRIRQFPIPARALAFGYLLALGLAYAYAVANIVIVVGLSPEKIAVHYYGSAKTIDAKPPVSGEQSLNLDEVEKSQATVGSRPNFKNLVSEGHFHLFGMASFFFGLTLLGLFTSLPMKVKTFFVSFPFIAIIADNLSFLATRFIGPKLAFLTAFSGAIMGVCFVVLWAAILWEIIQGGFSS